MSTYSNEWKYFNIHMFLLFTTQYILVDGELLLSCQCYCRWRIFFFHYEMVKLLSIEHAPAAADGFGCFCAFLLAFFSGFVHFCPAVLLNYSKLTKKRIRQNVK